MQRFRENHQPCYPAHYQLLLLMEILDEQGITSHHYLKGSGLFVGDILSGKKLITPLQFIKVLDNAQKLGNASTAFRWGHALWPGHYDEFSQLLNGTRNLRELCDALHNYCEILCPMLRPIIVHGDAYTFIYWRDEIGVSLVQSFLSTAYSTALLSLSHWYAKCKLPWRLGFAFNEPDASEEYIVTFGNKIQFGLGVNGLAIAREYLNVPWPIQTASESVYSIIKRKADDFYQSIDNGLVGELYGWLQDEIRSNPCLEDAAAAFNMSSATLKRKLKRHFTSFQKVQDQARYTRCLYLLHYKQWSNAQVAEYFQFSDANNFRKAFKRWCGDTPNGMRSRLEFYM